MHTTTHPLARQIALLILADDAMMRAAAARLAGRQVVAAHCHAGRAVVRTTKEHKQ